MYSTRGLRQESFNSDRSTSNVARLRQYRHNVAKLFLSLCLSFSATILILWGASDCKDSNRFNDIFQADCPINQIQVGLGIGLAMLEFILLTWWLYQWKMSTKAQNKSLADIATNGHHHHSGKALSV